MTTDSDVYKFNISDCECKVGTGWNLLKYVVENDDTVSYVYVERNGVLTFYDTDFRPIYVTSNFTLEVK